MAVSDKQASALWNERYPEGTKVRFWPMTRKDPARIGTTYGTAWMLGGHTSVICVRGDDGRDWGAVALSHVEPVAPKKPLFRPRAGMYVCDRNGREFLIDKTCTGPRIYHEAGTDDCNGWYQLNEIRPRKTRKKRTQA